MYFASREVRELRPILHGSELAVAGEITIPHTHRPHPSVGQAVGGRQLPTKPVNGKITVACL
jgi:hypothetical protein